MVHNLFEYLDSIRARDPAPRSRWEVLLYPGVLALGLHRVSHWLYGGGLSGLNVMDYGDYEAVQGRKDTDRLPGGVILDGKWDEVHPIDPRDPAQVQEFVTHSWYSYGDGNADKGLHPWDGVTEPKYELGPNAKGTKTDIREIDESAKYSWIKAPRWKGNAVEVGPLARYILAYAHGVDYVKGQVEDSLGRFNALAGTSLTPKQALPTTIGRTLARALEAHYCAQMMLDDFDHLIANIKAGDTSTANVEKWDPTTWPKEARGVGTVAASRGGLGHWIKIKDGRIENYQCVVPTTWNGGPRDPKGNIGAFEASLMNTPMERPEEPVEILRTLHSFDPCLACSTHVISPDGEEMARVTVR